MRDCIECGQPFQPSGRELICSDECRVERRRRSGVERFRRWREQHVEEHRARVRAAVAANPEARLERIRRRKQALRDQRPPGSEPVTRRTVWASGHGSCHYCRRELRQDGGRWEWQIDHRIPISRGGPNCLSNTVVSCAACNMAKGIMTDVEFMENRRKKIASEALENPGV